MRRAVRGRTASNIGARLHSASFAGVFTQGRTCTVSVGSFARSAGFWRSVSYYHHLTVYYFFFNLIILDMAIISTDTIATLNKLVRNREFSSRAIRVASLLALNHPDAEKVAFSLTKLKN